MALPPLITAMTRPDFYPDRPAEVTLVQTHISYVFLAGDEVYKVKKPVRFSFLDFSTLERRRHFCEEEVRLNRRLAADIYRGVVGLCADGGSYRLSECDEPAVVDYAVHMRRLPAELMLDRLLERDAADAALMTRLAQRLAAFHREAATSPEISANGSPVAIWSILEDNYSGAYRFRDRTFAVADDLAIQSFAAGFMKTQWARFQSRRAEHRIRDGHGDLRAEHICCQEEIRAFDCVEFNASFRCCDVASDLAFLAMDLDAVGRTDLCRYLIASYVAATGDEGLRFLMPFYQCYRAYVRGKVESLKSEEPEVEAAEREAARRSAGAHFALAYRYTWAYSPALVMVAGLSGTGKSTVAAALHERTGFVHLSSDVLRKQIAGIRPDTPARSDYDAGLYSAAHTAQTYAAMRSAAEEHLARGTGVILDATFQRRAERDAARALAAAHRVPALLIECRSDLDEVRRRLHDRSAEASVSDADWNVYLEQRRRYEPLAEDERADAMTFDTAQLAATGTRAIERELRRRTNA